MTVCTSPKELIADLATAASVVQFAAREFWAREDDAYVSLQVRVISAPEKQRATEAFQVGRDGSCKIPYAFLLVSEIL